MSLRIWQNNWQSISNMLYENIHHYMQILVESQIHAIGFLKEIKTWIKITNNLPPIHKQFILYRFVHMIHVVSLYQYQSHWQSWKYQYKYLQSCMQQKLFHKVKK